MATENELIIVTGSTGLIGRRVVERLAGRYRIARFARTPEPSVAGDGYAVDLTDGATIRQGLRAAATDHGTTVASVIHLAAYYDFSGEPSPLYREVTVEGTRRLLEGLRAAQFSVEQFLFSSSMLVHAPEEPPGEIEEEDELDPRWDYPRSKVRTEELIREQRGEFPAVLARIAGIYDEWCHSIPLAHQIQRIYERDPHSHLFPGALEHGQAFLHADDLVDAIERTVERRADLPPLCTLLLGEEQPLSYGRLQDRIGELIHGQAWPTISIPEAVAKAGARLEAAVGIDQFVKPWMIEFADDHYDLDISRARTELDWSPKRSLDETLPAMIENLLSDPERWYRENDLDSAGIPDDRRQPVGSARETSSHG